MKSVYLTKAKISWYTHENAGNINDFESRMWLNGIALICNQQTMGSNPIIGFNSLKALIDKGKLSTKALFVYKLISPPNTIISI